MAGKFITLILAASVAVTGMTVTPARAADRDLALGLAALAGIAVLGAAIHDAKRDKRYVAPQRHVQPIFGARRPHKAHKRHKRHNSKADRAYRQGYNDHRREVRDRRAERRQYRRDQRPQYGYSARPYRYGK
ncbi:hypothetical protein [Roseovarius sp. M141]|uniref:hypothetical protein n=1 Tax=Roseovarius sp. M141 TaxID=2583806 RepID=UPI0020CDD21E|nr:hypothetical protein [Roseovarius sp. M141]MCQ0091652.1 hypothetical protein [Roseovarius sp. M141]